MEADTGGTDAGFQSALFEHVFEKNGESMYSSTANQLENCADSPCEEITNYDYLLLLPKAGIQAGSAIAERSLLRNGRDHLS